MTYEQFAAARQLLVEERVGKRARDAVRREAAQAERAKEALRRRDRGR